MREGLKEKLGCILFQLPPTFKFNNESLNLIIESLNPEFNNVVEFRHIDWWQPEVYNKLAEHNISFCGHSFRGTLPDDVIQNTDLIYYRFHGRPVLYKSSYSKESLQDVSDQISNKAKKVFLYFNNTWGQSALENSMEMKRIINSGKGK